MKIDGKSVRLISRDGIITLMVGNEIVRMTLGEWSQLISNPNKE
jgi:hypothetical protein